jgi:TolB protein
MINARFTCGGRACSAACLAIIAAMHLGPLDARADNPPSAIFVMKVDGSEVRKIAQSPAHDDHSCPRWSHDGKRVAFDVSSGPRGKRELFIVNVDGTGLQAMGKEARPDWSPDDKQLAFDVYAPQGLQIHVKNIDGQGETSFARGVCGRWSPDGSRLATTDHHRMWVTDLVTGDESELFAKPFDYLWPGYNWSPDGKWLVLTARPEKNGKAQLLFVSPEGAEKGLKVRFEGKEGGAVSFSPDGKQMVLDSGSKIYLLDVDGGFPRLIPGQKGKNKDPHWSPDGQWIVFSSNRHLQ